MGLRCCNSTTDWVRVRAAMPLRLCASAFSAQMGFWAPAFAGATIHGIALLQLHDRLGTREGSDPSASLRLCVFCSNGFLGSCLRRSDDPWDCVGCNFTTNWVSVRAAIPLRLCASAFSAQMGFWAPAFAGAMIHEIPLCATPRQTGYARGQRSLCVFAPLRFPLRWVSGLLPSQERRSMGLRWVQLHDRLGTREGSDPSAFSAQMGFWAPAFAGATTARQGSLNSEQLP